MTIPPTTCSRRICSWRNTAARTTVRAGTRNWNDDRPGGPDDLDGPELHDVADGDREEPCIEDGDERRGRDHRPVDAIASCHRPSGAMTSVPNVTAQVVVRSGEWRRRTGAPNAT